MLLPLDLVGWLDWGMNGLARPSGLMGELCVVDHGMGNFLSGGAERFGRTWSVAEGTRFTEDAKPYLAHCQIRNDVRLLDGVFPGALICLWIVRSRRSAWLRLESVQRAVEPGWVMRHEITRRNTRERDNDDDWLLLGEPWPC